MLRRGFTVTRSIVRRYSNENQAKIVATTTADTDNERGTNLDEKVNKH